MAELHGELKNYKSFSESHEDASLEMERLIEKGLVKKITLEQAEHFFDKPVISKLGLIVKEKLDGAKKRRVIVDALRSGANQQARCPERIVLPRPIEVQRMLTDMKASEPQLKSWYRARDLVQDEWSAELVAADFTDAFTHFPVARQELQQCVSPAGDGKHEYVFVALFFGHKPRRCSCAGSRLSSRGSCRACITGRRSSSWAPTSTTRCSSKDPGPDEIALSA
mgnify:CR=1 FL=1